MDITGSCLRRPPWTGPGAVLGEEAAASPTLLGERRHTVKSTSFIKMDINTRPRVQSGLSPPATQRGFGCARCEVIHSMLFVSPSRPVPPLSLSCDQLSREA